LELLNLLGPFSKVVESRIRLKIDIELDHKKEVTTIMFHRKKNENDRLKRQLAAEDNKWWLENDHSALEVYMGKSYYW
jgi:hypothetical protein